MEPSFVSIFSEPSAVLSPMTVPSLPDPCSFVVLFLERQNPPEPRANGVNDTSRSSLRFITMSYKSHGFWFGVPCMCIQGTNSYLSIERMYVLARAGEGEAFTHHLSCMCVCMSFAVPFSRSLLFLVRVAMYVWFGLSLPMRGGEARALIRLFYPFTRY